MLDSLVVSVNKMQCFAWFITCVSIILLFRLSFNVILSALVGHVIFTRLPPFFVLSKTRELLCQNDSGLLEVQASDLARLITFSEWVSERSL